MRKKFVPFGKSSFDVTAYIPRAYSTLAAEHEMNIDDDENVEIIDDITKGMAVSPRRSDFFSRKTHSDGIKRSFNIGLRRSGAKTASVDADKLRKSAVSFSEFPDDETDSDEEEEK